MRELLAIECHHLSAGVVQYAAGAVVAFELYNNAADLIESTQKLNDVGRHLGEVAFDYHNPNPLGQTVYTPDDFKR